VTKAPGEEERAYQNLRKRSCVPNCFKIRKKQLKKTACRLSFFIT